MLQSIENIFCNYQSNKLDITNPNWTNIFIISLFFLFVLLTTKKRSPSQNILNIQQTDQLRGLAIFFVILGHLWVHVSKTRAQIVFSGDAVSLFLILSGFGLSMSAGLSKLNFKQFFSKRIKRVMVPYWIATLLVLLLDLSILGKLLPIDGLLMTLFGLNLKAELCDLDYTRWFVTFILLWYLFFFICTSKLSTKKSLVFLLSIAFLLLPANYYIFHLYWCQFFAFPVGCGLAIYHDKLEIKYKEKRNIFLILSSVGISYVLMWKILMSHESVSKFVVEAVPNIFLLYLDEGNSLIISLAAVFVFGFWGWKGYESQFLLFLGKYSYELFLLHGVFLIKYNPIIKNSGSLAVIIEFSLLLFLMIGLSYAMFRTYNFKYVRKAS